MTNIIVNTKNIEKKTIPIQEAKFGTWYRIVKYDHNPGLVGKFGVCTVGLIEDVPLICSPTGCAYAHPDFVLEEISKVEVICS